MLLPRLWRALVSAPLSDPPVAAPADTVQALGERLLGVARTRLGRSLAVFELDAGGCGGCALEVEALRGAAHGLERYGLAFTASPRQADVLLVTGPATRNMREALERTLACMPEPRWVVAAGGCAADGGVFKGSYAVLGGVAEVLPVDLVIPGCPPAPPALLEGLLSLLAAEEGGQRLPG
jgi:Ni,Fe-hydrogenase III small subunit